MAKPKRKFPGFYQMEGSPQARQFKAIFMHYLGREVLPKPLESLKDSHIFLAIGSLGTALLVEQKEIQKGDTWLHRMGFITESQHRDCLLIAELTAHMWDPWLHAKVKGNREVLDLPAAKRRAESEERTRKVGSKRDRVSVRIMPTAKRKDLILGLSSDFIDEVKGRHNLRLSSESFVGDPQKTDQRPARSLASRTKTVRELVESILISGIEDLSVTPDGNFAFAHGGSSIIVRVHPWDPTVLVTVTAITNRGIDPSDGLYEYVARHSDDWVFGHLGLAIVEDGATVSLRHTLLGETLQPPELASAIRTIAPAAQKVGSDIKSRFGGYLGTEVPTDGATRPRGKEYAPGGYL